MKSDYKNSLDISLLHLQGVFADQSELENTSRTSANQGGGILSHFRNSRCVGCDVYTPSSYTD